MPCPSRVEIRVAHLPSYCSKYNPIERRIFSHVGRACSGHWCLHIDYL
ncbi:ISAzo13-like element transposase-related protein [Novipirellula rosea]